MDDSCGTHHLKQDLKTANEMYKYCVGSEKAGCIPPPPSPVKQLTQIL